MMQAVNSITQSGQKIHHPRVIDLEFYNNNYIFKYKIV